MLKRFLSTTTLLSLACIGAIHADNFSFRVSGFGTGEADFDTPAAVVGQNIKHSYLEAAGDYTMSLSDSNSLVLQAGYTAATFDWAQNPITTEKDFANIDYGVTFVSTYVDQWLWRIGLAAHTDTEEMDLEDYTIFDGMLWGTYELSDETNVHVGFLANYGLDKDEVFPILGFQYAPEGDWAYNLVFPVNMSVERTIDDQWSVAGAFRYMKNRHRVAEDATVSKAIFENKALGGELALNYDQSESATGSLFVGYHFGGHFRTYDENGKNSTTYVFKAAPYFGGRLAMTF